MRMELFTAYTDKVDPAFVFFRVLLRARAGDSRLPRVYKAMVHVSLRLGWLGRLLFLVWPAVSHTPVIIRSFTLPHAITPVQRLSQSLYAASARCACCTCCVCHDLIASSAQCAQACSLRLQSSLLPACCIRNDLHTLQGRPGPWAILLLAAAGLCALGGGCITLVAIVGLWLLSGPAGSASGSKADKDVRDDISEGTAASDADSSAILLDLKRTCPVFADCHTALLGWYQAVPVCTLLN